MAGFNESDVISGKSRVKPWRVAVYSVIYLTLIFILAILQSSGICLFGNTPDMLLALVCAIGFISGAGYGAIFGLISAVIISLISGAGFTLVPITYVLCGYFCGALINKFLSPNFVSFLIFGALCGVVREIFTLIHFGLVSDEFNFTGLIKNVVIGEYFAYFLCLIPAYFTVLGIYLLFKGKDDKSR
jgi:hypothetical protein